MTANTILELKELYDELYDVEKKLDGSLSDEINLIVHF